MSLCQTTQLQNKSVSSSASTLLSTGFCLALVSLVSQGKELGKCNLGNEKRFRWQEKKVRASSMRGHKWRVSVTRAFQMVSVGVKIGLRKTLWSAAHSKWPWFLCTITGRCQMWSHCQQEQQQLQQLDKVGHFYCTLQRWMHIWELSKGNTINTDMEKMWYDQISCTLWYSQQMDEWNCGVHPKIRTGLNAWPLYLVALIPRRGI